MPTASPVPIPCDVAEVDAAMLDVAREQLGWSTAIGIGSVAIAIAAFLFTALVNRNANLDRMQELRRQFARDFEPVITDLHLMANRLPNNFAERTMILRARALGLGPDFVNVCTFWDVIEDAVEAEQGSVEEREDKAASMIGIVLGEMGAWVRTGDAVFTKKPDRAS